MSKSKKIIVRIVAAVTFITPLVAIVPTSYAAAQACTAIASIWKSGNYAIFEGGRRGCSRAVNVTVHARRHVPMAFDQELSSQSFSTANGTRTLSVWGTKGHVYFTQTNADDGAVAYSSRMTF